MLSPDTLTQTAIRHTHAHAQRTLNGEFLVTAGQPNTRWDAFLMRHSHQQELVIWRKYGKFDIILDAAGKLVGFIDHDKATEPGDAGLDQETAQSIVASSGIIPDGARLESYTSIPAPSGDGKFWKAVYSLANPQPDYEILEVEINAAKRAIVSVRPKRREGRNA